MRTLPACVYTHAFRQRWGLSDAMLRAGPYCADSRRRRSLVRGISSAVEVGGIQQSGVQWRVVRWTRPADFYSHFRNYEKSCDHIFGYKRLPYSSTGPSLVKTSISSKRQQQQQHGAQPASSLANRNSLRLLYRVTLAIWSFCGCVLDIVLSQGSVKDEQRWRNEGLTWPPLTCSDWHRRTVRVSLLILARRLELERCRSELSKWAPCSGVRRCAWPSCFCSPGRHTTASASSENWDSWSSET